MEHDVADTRERLRLHCVKFADTPAATWEAAITLLAQVVTLTGIRLPASGKCMERQDATKVMEALFDLGGHVPRISIPETNRAETINVGATHGS